MCTKRYISLTAHPVCHNLIIIGISCYLLLFFLYLAVARGHKHCYKAHATIRCGRRNDSPRRALAWDIDGLHHALPARCRRRIKKTHRLQTNSLLNATSAAYNISSRLTAHKTKQLQACPLYSLDLWCSLPVLLVTLPCEYHRPETRQRVCRGTRP